MRAGLCYGIHLYDYKDAQGNHRESEHGKEHRKLWQRQHPSFVYHHVEVYNKADDETRSILPLARI